MAKSASSLSPKGSTLRNKPDTPGGQAAGSVPKGGVKAGNGTTGKSPGVMVQGPKGRK